MIKQVGRAKGGQTNVAFERLPEWQIVNDLVAASISRHTLQIYRSSQRKFQGWCSERQVNSLPAQSQTVAMFLASEVRAGIRPATLVRHLAAIRRAHLEETGPTSAEVVRAVDASSGPRRYGSGRLRSSSFGQWRERSRRAERGSETGRSSARLRGCPPPVRTRGASLRRHRYRSARRTPRPSAFQNGSGGSRAERIRAAGYDPMPVQAVQNWLRISEIVDGVPFRRIRKDGAILDEGMAPHTINRLIKAAARRAGIQDRAIAGHSLRSGLLTAAALRGASVWKLMQVSRHRQSRLFRAMFEIGTAFGITLVLVSCKRERARAGKRSFLSLLR